MNTYLKSMLDPPKSILEASNDIISTYDEELTEYGYAMFYSRLPINFTEEEHDKCMESALLDQSLKGLIDKGFVTEMFDPDSNEPVYKLTDKGKEYAKLQMGIE